MVLYKYVSMYNVCIFSYALILTKKRIDAKFVASCDGKKIVIKNI